MKHIVIISLLLILSLSCSSKIVSQPKAVKGIMDLRNWDSDHFAVALDGEWEFYPNQLIHSGFSSDKFTQAPKFIIVPGTWNNSYGSRFGFATYRLSILLPDKDKLPYVFKLSEMGTAYSMFVNGHLVASNGKVGKTEETSKPQFLPLITESLELNSKIEIVVHISNFHNRDGGFWYSILLGKEKVIRDIREQKMFNSLFIYGCLFTMFIYHIAIFLIRKKDKSALVFSLFCLSVVFHLLVFDEKFLNQIFPKDTFLLLNRIEYLSYYLAVPLFSNFLYLVFSEDFHKRMMQIIWYLAISFSSIVILTGSEIYTFTIPYYHVFTLISMFYFLLVFYKAVKLRREGAQIIFIGTVIFFVGILNDILHSLTLIRTMFIFPQGLMVFLFSHSIVISIKFTSALSQVERLSESLLSTNIGLEEKVIQRTKEFKLEKEKAEEASKIKDKFVSIVSHDLRSPLQGVLNLLEILNNKKIRKTYQEKKRYLQVCFESIKFSLSMIRQLLDMSRIESGTLIIHKEEVFLRVYIQNVLDELKPFYLAKNISIIPHVSDSDTVSVDVNLFKQVLSNLLANSIKYSYVNQSIDIHFKSNTKGKTISISDKGIGMTKNQIKEIKSQGMMRSIPGTANETGSGMGIYICQYIIDAHKGSIQFKSKKGKGTEVEIILPSK